MNEDLYYRIMKELAGHELDDGYGVLVNCLAMVIIYSSNTKEEATQVMDALPGDVARTVALNFGPGRAQYLKSQNRAPSRRLDS
jgi:hypothetical protein